MKITAETMQELQADFAALVESLKSVDFGEITLTLSVHEGQLRTVEQTVSKRRKSGGRT